MFEEDELFFVSRIQEYPIVKIKGVDGPVEVKSVTRNYLDNHMVYFGHDSNGSPVTFTYADVIEEVR